MQITNTRIHANGRLYKKFVFKNDPTKKEGYVRVVSSEDEMLDPKWCLYEIFHVYSTDTYEYKNGVLRRIVKEKVSVDSFRYDVFTTLLPAMEIIEEFTTISLNTYEEIIYSANMIEG